MAKINFSWANPKLKISLYHKKITMSDQHSNRFRAYYPIVLSLFLAIGVLLGMWLANTGKTRLPFGGNTGKINDILSYIKTNYVDTVNRQQLMDAAIDGMLTDLDPHSQYIPASDFNDVNDQLRGKFEGIGVQFRIIKDTIVIINTITGGPSEKVGVLGGDRIVKIEGKNITGPKFTDKDVIKQLKGPKGTKVKIDVLRKGSARLLPFTITRDVIPTWSIDASYMINDATGYIKLSKFSATTTEEITSALDSLEKSGMKNLILDLRGNGGGYLQAAVDLADEFLPDKSTVVYTQGLNRKKQVYMATSKGSFEGGKVAVLIDEGSASASEIIAGAIQDNDRGTIIGRRSFGKGLVQEQLDFKDGSAVRLTVARYYTPTGRCIQKPYSKGALDYNHEYMDRFSNGEVEHPDSIKFADSLKFKTPKGKVVYGGGGIMPDIYIPLKSDSNYVYLNKLTNAGAFTQWSFDYTDRERNNLRKIPDYRKFDQFFVVTPAMLEEFAAYAAKIGVPKNPKGMAYNKKEIESTLKSLIARNLYDDKGFYAIYNKTDKTVQKALETLQKK
jgi:carboxyl-terminal processing protease